MGFQPEVNARIDINGKSYLFGAHPHAPGVPYGQEGRQGTVYLLHSEDRREKKAIKVFRNKFVNPSMVFLTQQLTKHKGMSGLSACERFVVTPQNNTELLSKEPDLLYAVIMPWIDGPTWMDVLLGKQSLTKKQSYLAASSLAHALMNMEQRGLAHCDLSAPNLILPLLDNSLRDVSPVDYVQLIDLEQMYSSQLERPEHIPAGSPGYASQMATQSMMWSAQSDRFAGAILLMEMLGACTDSFMENAWGESYFAPSEMQSRCDRYDQFIHTIRTHWGSALASLFARVWESEELTQCPTFGEWLMELSKIESSIMNESARAASAITSNESIARVESEEGNHSGTLLKKAKKLESQGKTKEAIEVYRSIYALNPHTSLTKEVDIAIASLEKKKANEAMPRKRETETSKGKKAIRISAIILMLGLVGSLAYKAYGDADNKPTASELNSANARIESLNQALADSNKKNAQLALQLKEQRKPPAQKTKDLINLLNEDYFEIKSIANSDSTELDKKTFEASEKYLQHLFDFVQVSLSQDEQWTDQTSIVQGYYFPYIYNRDRNAQLNLQFFANYKKNFK